MVTQTKKSSEYVTAKQKYEDSIPAGDYRQWEISNKRERYDSTVDLLKEILKADGVFDKIGVYAWGGTSSNIDIINYFVPVIVSFSDINFKSDDSELSFYVKGARCDLVYRIYNGDVNNNDYEDWRFDWAGNLLESTTNVSMSEYVRSLESERQINEQKAKEEQENNMLDAAGVPLEFRFDYHAGAPEVIVSGYMRNGTQFVLDQKIAFKGKNDADTWNIIDELYIASRYDLEYDKRYTLKGVLRYDALQEIEVIEEVG